MLALQALVVAEEASDRVKDKLGSVTMSLILIARAILERRNSRTRDAGGVLRKIVVNTVEGEACWLSLR